MKTFAHIALLIALGTSFMPVSAHAQNNLVTGYVTDAINRLAASCDMPTPTAQEITCVTQAGQAAFLACFASSNEANPVTKVNACVNRGIQSGAGSLPQCLPRATEDQRSCFLQKAGAVVNAVAGGGNGTVAANANNSTSYGFQPLTSLPALGEIKAGSDLASFFNQLYVLAVGAAAVLAVAQIMIAGFKWATAGGSHSAIEQSRDLIRNSVLGLLLVLSPTLVFSIINPNILSLKIDTSILKDRPAVGIDPTCADFPNLHILDREPTAEDTWSSSDSLSSYYGQCCNSAAQLPSGSRCQVLSTDIGKGQYCGCTEVTEKWHLLIGGVESDGAQFGGLVVQFRTTSAPDGTGENCVLGASDGAESYYESEAACKTAYGTEDKVTTLIRNGKLGAYAQASSCFAASNALHGMGGTPPTGVKITAPAKCSTLNGPSGKEYVILP